MTKQFWRNPGPYDPPGQPLDGRMRAPYHEKGKEKKLKLKLKSIAEEANACWKAFKNIAIGSNVVHCHHSREYETLEEPAENRISYILSNKPKREQALRLRLFRPVKGSALAEYKKVKGPALVEYEKVEGPALAEHEKVAGSAWAEYKKVTDLAWAEYKKVAGPALAEYKKVAGSALVEYEKVKGPALVEYEKVTGLAHSLICKTKGCTWNGVNISGLSPKTLRKCRL